MNTTMENSTACNLPPSYWNVVHGLNFADFFLLMPLRFVFGLTGQLLAIFGFRKQTKFESAYAYQTYVSVWKVIEICFYVPHILIQYHWAGGIDGLRPGRRADWFVRCHGCMWYVAHVCNTVQTVVLTLSLLLATAMAVDRAFALARPFAYRLIDHRRHQRAAAVICVLGSILVSSDAPWRNRVIRKDTTAVGEYWVANSGLDYSTSILFAVANHSRTILRVISVVIMAISYATIIHFYDKRMRQVVQLTGRSGGSQKVIERKRHQKTLYVLAMFQLPLEILTVFLLACTNVLAFASPSSHACIGAFLLAFISVAVDLTDTLEIYVIMGVSSVFRRMIISTVPLWNRMADNNQSTGT